MLDSPPHGVTDMESKGWSEMANAAMEDFVRWCEGKLAKSRDQLEPLESGRVHFGIAPSEDDGRTSRCERKLGG